MLIGKIPIYTITEYPAGIQSQYEEASFPDALHRTGMRLSIPAFGQARVALRAGPSGSDELHRFFPHFSCISDSE